MRRGRAGPARALPFVAAGLQPRDIREEHMRTRLLTSLALLAALAACSQPEQASRTEAPAATPSPAPVPTAGRLFVTNEQGGDISVIDVAAQRVTATIPVGKRPRGIRLSPDGTQLFVALSGSPMAPPGVDESTLPPPDKKRRRHRRRQRARSEAAARHQGRVRSRADGDQPGRHAPVRRQRGRRRAERRVGGRRQASWRRSRSAASRKASICVPTAGSSTSRRRKTARSRSSTRRI